MDSDNDNGVSKVRGIQSACGHHCLHSRNISLTLSSRKRAVADGVRGGDVSLELFVRARSDGNAYFQPQRRTADTIGLHSGNRATLKTIRCAHEAVEHDGSERELLKQSRKTLSYQRATKEAPSRISPNFVCAATVSHLSYRSRSRKREC